MRAQFNDDVPDAPGIAYFSIAGQFQPHRILGVPQGPLGLTHDIIAATDSGNDGLVSVASATFAERPETWTTLDAWDANHFRLVNWGTDIRPTLRELADNSIVERYRSLVTRVKKSVGGDRLTWDFYKKDIRQPHSVRCNTGTRA